MWSIRTKRSAFVFYKLWLIPLLSLCMIIPILIGAGIYFIIVKGASTYFHHLLFFSSPYITLSLLDNGLPLNLRIHDSSYHQYGFCLPLSKGTRVEQIIAQNFRGRFYHLSLVMMPGVHIKGFLIAFLISFAVYLFDFIGNEVNDFIKTRKKNMKQD